MVLYSELFSHIDPVYPTFRTVPALEVFSSVDDVPFVALLSSAAMDLDLVGRQHIRAACERIHRVLVVRPVRVRVRVAGDGAGRVGVFFALRDVSVRLAPLAHPVWEYGGEEGPHQRDTGAHAAHTRLEHGPEE